VSEEVRAILARFVYEGHGLPRFQEELLLRQGLTTDQAQAALETWEEEVRLGIPDDPIWRAGQLLEEALAGGHETVPTPEPLPTTPAPPSPGTTPASGKGGSRKQTPPLAPRGVPFQALQPPKKDALPPEEPRETGGAEVAGGWVRLYRCALDSDILRVGGLRLFGLFCCLLLEAEWKPRRVNGDFLEPGQLSITLRSYATAHGLSVKELRGSLEKLRRNGTILAQQKAHRRTVITLVNWALYNGEGGEEGTAQGTAQGTVRAQLGHSGSCKRLTCKGMQAPKKLRSKEERKEPAPPALNHPSQENEIDPEQVRRDMAYLAEKAAFYKGQEIPERDRRRVLDAARYRLRPACYPSGPPPEVLAAFDDLRRALRLEGEA